MPRGPEEPARGVGQRPRRHAPGRHVAPDPGRARRPLHLRRPSRGHVHARPPTLRVWAPTARSVKLHLFATSERADPRRGSRHDAGPRHRGVDDRGGPGWEGRFYLYEVEVFVRATGRVERNLVTDPYSVSLSRNSGRSQIVDLASPEWMPAGWRPPAQAARCAAPEDIVLYELHVRDFSASDPTVPEALRGDVPGVHRSTPTACGTCARSPARASPTSTCCRRSTSPPSTKTSSQWQDAGDLSGYPAGLRPAAGGGDGRRRRRTASTGATTPGTTRCPRAATRSDPDGAHARASSSGRWSRA